ncbi:hypothetical protein DFP72DRAFT_1097039 [Ephemerocybe angulata]|uniref:HECT-type E3 ubiquitin transferase n=1 Tax=Ephemerocybe angulata TaxID=980116 RepID=A0A8H6I7C8_9AGAR|nr:hypothetical protein DFP72DRAFT_1097039 [Tulosesus angulatus]
MKIVNKSKKPVAPPPQLAEFIKKLAAAPTEEVAKLLVEVDTWKWPRSDLNAWIKVLNRLDSILEDVIKEYELDKLQLRPFSDEAKQLVSEILRFERLLMENSTNRKTFNSYDVCLNSLLFTSDLDVLILALNLLLRPSQQYSAQPAVTHALSLSSARLQALAKKWPHVRENGTTLVDLVSSKNESELEGLPTEAREVALTFYRTESEAKEQVDAPVQVPETPRKAAPVSSNSTGVVNIFLTEQEVLAKPPMQVLADLLSKCAIPEDQKFEVLCRIRTASSLSSERRSEREKLLIARLLAIAIFSHTHPEPEATSTLFVYEPDLINHIAELLQVDNGVPVAVQTAAIAALDALARYRSRMQEVLTAVNAAVNHGILMGLFRRTVSDVANAESTTPQSFIEALLAFMTFIVSHASGVNMVVGAGLIPLLIQLVENKTPNRLATVSKTMQLLDNVLYSYTNGFQMFCAAQGVNVIVDRIEYEIDYDIEHYGSSPASKEIAPATVELPVSRIAVLKHILRSMHRMMQSAGTAEGLRNLVNLSLLKSVKKIIEYRGLFGPSILPFAINIMSTFVHNEPTSLTIIQENNLPETFYNAIEAGIEPAMEVIQSIPNAIGALCLNEVGQTQLSRRPSIIPAIFTLFTSEKHLKVLNDKENAVVIGTAIDELIRHHPSLKTPIFEALKSTLSRIEDLGNAYVAPPELSHWYQITAISPSVDAEVSMDVDEQEPPTQKEPSSAPSSGEGEQSEEENVSKSHDNIIVNYIDVLGRFLEGLFQHPPHCKDFISMTDGVTRIGNITSLPCLPYDYANSVASDSLVQVMRTMVEVATTETLQELVKLVQTSLKDTEDFWSTPSPQSKLLDFVDVSEDGLEDANRKFRNLVTLHIRSTLLSDVFSTHGYNGGRSSAVGLLQVLMGHLTPKTVKDLGSLHRASIWENIVLNAGLAGKGVDVGTLGISGDVTPSVLENEVPEAEAGATAAGTSIATTHEDQSNSTAEPTAPKKLTPASSGPRFQNAQAFKHIAHGIPNALAPFFQSMIKTCHSRRNPDTTHKKLILETTQLVADIMIQHLQLRDMIDIEKLRDVPATDDTNSLLFTYLYDCHWVVLDRTSNVVVHTIAVWSFYKSGGFDWFFKVFEQLTLRIGEILDKPEETRSIQEKRELIQAFGGLKVALHLLHPIISSKAVEAGQAHLILTRDKKDTDPDYFELHNFLVKLRLAALPTVYTLWTRPWLIQSPLGVSRAIVKNVLEIVSGEGEESRGEIPPEALGIVPQPHVPRPPQGPDEARVRVLIDMGFPRSAAERALVRTHNNVNAAAELLVNHPFPLPPDPEPEPAAAPPVEEAPAAPAQEAPTDEPMAAEPAEPPAEQPAPAPEVAQEEPAAAEEPQEAQGVQEVQETPSEEPAGPPGKSAEEWRTELNEARKPLIDSLSSQALLLIDEHQQLLFDLQKAFTKSSPQQKQAIQNLVDDIKTFSPQAYDVREQPLANRCRLLALVLCEPPNPLSPETVNQLMDNLLALLSSITIENPPKWLAAHLLVTEALFTLAEEPRSITLPKEGEPIVQEPISVGPSRAAARTTVFKLCLRLLALEDLGSDELLSVLRLFVLFTRTRDVANQFIEANGPGMLFQRLKASPVSGGSSYIAIILRHLVEDSATIQNIMQHGIKRYFSQPRARIVEISTYVKNCSSIALRDIEAFIESTKSLCQLGQIYTPSPHISLQPDVAQATTTQAKSDSGDMAIDNPQANTTAPATVKLAESVVHPLVNELMTSAKALSEQQAAAAQPAVPPTDTSADTVFVVPEDASSMAVEGASTQPDDKKEADAKAESDLYERYHYVCFLLQCLSELVLSYDSCKVAFLSFSPKKKAHHTPAKDTAHNRFRSATLQFFLTDLVTFGTINPQPDSKMRNRVMLCNWAMTALISLCAESSANIDAKEVSSDLTSVRKYVLETVSRTIKDLPTSENLDSKYGRLLALADLCNRLLNVRFNVPPTQRKPNAEIPTHLAKIMLEKNYVSTLTTSLSEIDLNYPNVKALVTGILRPLQYLSKVAMKMSRSSSKQKEDADEEGSISDSSVGTDDDEDDEVEREETPDLYRNSALGMYGGEMDDGHRYAEDEEMGDEGDDDEDDDVDMEFGEETGSEDTENTDDDDDDDVDLGEDDEDVDASEDAWEDGEDEEEDGLIENPEDVGDDDDDDDEDRDEDGGPDVLEDEGAEDEEEMLWEDIDEDGGLEANPDEFDEEDETGAKLSLNAYEVPIQIIHEDEAEMGSDEEFHDHGFFNFDSVFNGEQMFVNGGHPRDAGMFVPRRARAHGIVEETGFPGRSRGGSAPEATVHPLLLNTANSQRASNSQRGSRHHGHTHTQRLTATAGPELIQQLEEVMGPGSGQVLEQLIQQGAAGVFPEGFRLEVPGAAFLNIRQTGFPRRGGPFASIRVERAPRPSGQRMTSRDFEPLPTVQRWIEETKILHGDFVNERVGKLVNHVTLALLPAAIEAAKQAKQREEEEAARLAEEKSKEEAREKEEKEKESAQVGAAESEGASIIPEKMDAEPTVPQTPASPKMEAAPSATIPSPEAPALSSSEAIEQPDQVMEEATATSEVQDTEMADIEETGQPQPSSVNEAAAPEQVEPSASTSAPERERITVMIHGSAVDITDTGIDPDFLSALPDDMREEVLNQHVRDQRAARVERPADSQISSEFLDALPPDIRAEILQQEAIERERRRVEEAAPPPASGPVEIDPASFIASLDPTLRQAVLMEQEEGFIASLPSHMIAEAEGYRGGLELAGGMAALAPGRRHIPRTSAARALPPGILPPVKPRPQHDAIQLLDKAGIATLIRLLFFPQVLRKTLLFKVLVNLCENSKTRTELFNLLLSILQDGTGDLAAVDKSFAQMSVRGIKPQPPKQPQTPKSVGKQKVGGDYFNLPVSQIEAFPDLIAQKCLDALNFIVTSNELASLFFLTEHELPAGLRKSAKKGKGKERLLPQSHYPIVLLLGLLDRQSLLRTPAIMESVVSLLATVTRPLTSLKDAKPTPSATITGPSIAGEAQPAADETTSGPSVEGSSTTAPGPTVSESTTAAAPPLPPSSAAEAAPEAATSSTQPPAPAESEPKIESVEEKVLLANPPQIPHAVLRLIVNILTIGECSGRTFQQSLALIQHLSCIPDARDVIAQELKAKAQEFGHTLITDLEELAKALHDGNEAAMTSTISTKFSPASSTQAKLLRVLKTIDYMYTPRSSSTSKDKEKDKAKDIEKVQAIYESFRFSLLWKKLGSCLEVIGEKPDTEHIGTVLLPLIESLMVVCKYVGSMAQSAIAARALRGTSSPRSPTTPKESMEELFISFTDAHRKVLNLMVRNNPSLMSGSFSLLVNNPRVLDFDNKRNYFNQQVHRRPHMREHHGTLQLSVRRARVFEDSYQYLQRKTGEQIKYGKLNVRFYDEEGVDAGGVTREWFQILARQMFDPNNALFQPCAADKLTYQPNKNSWVNPEHLSFFKFVGRVIGKAIYDGRLLDAYFARSLYRQLLGKPVDYKDVEWVDPEYYKSLCWILENDPTVLDLTFSVEADEFGVNRIIPLKEGGESIIVTQENKREFVQLSAQYRLYSSIKEQIESFTNGFYEIIPKDLITIFNEQELELLISGTPDIDVDEWRAATEYVGYTSTDPNIVWWWRALKSFNRDERAKVLSFATGTSKVPLNGFTELQGVQGVQRFSIHKAYGENDRLPQAHTCFNQIDLPQFSSYEMLRQQLLMAINEGGEGFAFS